MKYMERVDPTEISHRIEVPDSELKLLLDLANVFAKHDATVTISGQTFRPNDVGFDKLAGIVQMLNIVPLENYDAKKFWKAT